METLGPSKRIYLGYIGVILGLYAKNGKENGNYHIKIGVYIGDILGIMEKKMETTIV